MFARLARMSLGVLLVPALAVLAGCAGRPSAADYAAYQDRLLSKGKLRVEAAAADAPFDAADLARNYERVALNREADSTRPGGDDNLRPSPLKRWVGPLRYQLRGSGVTAADRAEAAQVMGRIAELAGIDVAEADGESGANFLILITTPEERDRVIAGLEKAAPRFARTFEFWRQRRGLICVADNLFAPENPNLLVGAMVVIGAETGGLLRRSCLHEEIVQALGLANDHPEVRPSVFNDDGEFALLTRHDELLIRLHHDDRLSPGMTAEEAMPVVRRIARELAPRGGPDGAPGIAAAMTAESE